MTKRIIICGYPKSGNTWITRLTAEIVGCPVVGFWCQPFNREEAIEGLDRESDYQCFKAHHSLDQLQHTLKIYGNGTEKVIYIYRDPRDIVVSASQYFKAVPRYRLLHRLLSAAPLGIGLYYKQCYLYSYRLDVFTRGLIEGTAEGAWLKTPWKTHVEGFLADSRFLCLSYESLKHDSLAKASAICDFLSINRPEASLGTAIHTQSFRVKKRKFQEEEKASKAAFLHKGEVGGWREVLSKKHITFIESHIGAFLTDLGYPVAESAGLAGKK